jgi:hypothetical protein
MRRAFTSPRHALCAVRRASLLFALCALLLPSPSHGAATVTADSVTFAWNPSAGAVGYYLLYAPYETEPFDGVFTGKVDVGSQTRVSYDLWEGAAFHVAVQAYNSAGVSAVSNVVSFVKPRGATSPILDIKVNGSGATREVSSTDKVSLTISIHDPYEKAREVWVTAETPSGFSSYAGSRGWVDGIVRCEGIPPGTLIDHEVMNTSLSPGRHQFYLAVDESDDRFPDGTWWDCVEVDVTGWRTWWEMLLGPYFE